MRTLANILFVLAFIAVLHLIALYTESLTDLILKSYLGFIAILGLAINNKNK